MSNTHLFSNFYYIDERAQWYIYILIYLILVVFCTVCTFAKMFVFRLSFWFLIYCAIRTVLATLLDFQISWINESRVSYHKLCCGIRFRPNFPQYCAVLIYVYNSTVLLFLTDFDDDVGARKYENAAGKQFVCKQY